MRSLVFFFQSGSAGGIVLMLASLLGIIIANSPFAAHYFDFLQFKFAGLSTLLWINDALMAIFFLYVGLEVKREMLHGQLNSNKKRVLPGLAALFGLLVPAIIYVVFNYGNTAQLDGWAIPTATDIAFALGVIALLGDRVPASLKVFLTALAIMDDLMAIIIIALFYSSNLLYSYLLGALACLIVLFLFNRKNIISPWPYIAVGTVLWFCVLKSGIHATLAGVVLALMIPFKAFSSERVISPLVEWEHALNPWVTFLITPIFGFANAGVSFNGFSLHDLLHPIVLGIALGLFVGKQLGVFTLVYSMVKLNFVTMPEEVTWAQVYGVALICGIGFTMSLFVSLLAFSDVQLQEYSKIGVFLGSLLSGLLGYIVLRMAPKKTIA